MTERTVEAFRVKFKYSLVGRWITAEGTFFLMSDYFEFNEDGTGQWISEAGSTGKQIEKFDWRAKGVQTIEMKFYDEDENGAETTDWIEVEYDFKVSFNDVCGQVILYSGNTDTFWLALNKVTYGGPIIT